MQFSNRLVLPAMVLMLSIGVVTSASAQVAQYELNVNLIWVANDTGGDASPLYSHYSTNSAVWTMVSDEINRIWLQAGITITFSSHANTFNSLDALRGTQASGARHFYDINRLTNVQLWQATPSAVFTGVLDFLEPQRNGSLNMLFVQQMPGASGPPGGASGLAWMGANGIVMATSSGMLDGDTNILRVARVMAHEIGHNLGLDHPDDYDNFALYGGADYNAHTNLMTSGTRGIPGGTWLTDTQLNIALTTAGNMGWLTVVIPEPTTLVLLTLGGLLLNRRRRAA
jgi:hypothetical protein